LATSHFRLSVACSDRRKAFGVLVIFRVYHAYCILLYTRLLHCMKNTPFLLVKYASQPLLEKDKPFFFWCDFRSELPPVTCLYSRVPSLVKYAARAWGCGTPLKRAVVQGRVGRRKEHAPRSLAVLAPLRSLLRICAYGG
jgi:hypothetical protein